MDSTAAEKKRQVCAENSSIIKVNNQWSLTVRSNAASGEGDRHRLLEHITLR